MAYAKRIDRDLRANADLFGGLSMERLDSSDTDRIAAHLLRLATFDRYLRFFSPVSDHGIRRIVDGFDWDRMIAVGISRGPAVHGIAEIGWTEKTVPECGELAVSVDAEFRNRGLGRWLVTEACRLAAARGIRRVQASWLGGNDIVPRIMGGLGARVLHDGRVWQGEADISP